MISCPLREDGCPMRQLLAPAPGRSLRVAAHVHVSMSPRDGGRSLPREARDAR